MPFFEIKPSENIENNAGSLVSGMVDVPPLRRTQSTKLSLEQIEDGGVNLEDIQSWLCREYVAQCGNAGFDYFKDQVLPQIAELHFATNAKGMANLGLLLMRDISLGDLTEEDIEPYMQRAVQAEKEFVEKRDLIKHNMLNVVEQYLEIEEDSIEDVPISGVIIIGSWGKNAATSRSDLDILLIRKERIYSIASFSEESRIKKILSKNLKALGSPDQYNIPQLFNEGVHCFDSVVLDQNDMNIKYLLGKACIVVTPDPQILSDSKKLLEENNF